MAPKFVMPPSANITQQRRCSYCSFIAYSTREHFPFWFYFFLFCAYMRAVLLFSTVGSIGVLLRI